MKITKFILKELRNLSKSQELIDDLAGMRWAPGYRARIILEVDVENDGPILHGYEVRKRVPARKE